jgi:hypothetical protein
MRVNWYLVSHYAITDVYENQGIESLKKLRGCATRSFVPPSGFSSVLVSRVRSDTPPFSNR